MEIATAIATMVQQLHLLLLLLLLLPLPKSRIILLALNITRNLIKKASSGSPFLLMLTDLIKFNNQS